MKKIYLSLLGVMTALTVCAQQQLLSHYTLDPVTNEKTWQCDYTYANGKPAEEHATYYYADGNEEYKTLYIYDDQGRLLRTEDYDLRDGEYVMTYLQESLEWNEDGLPTTFIEYTEDEDNPGQLVQEWKEVVYRYESWYYGWSAVDYDYYYPDGAGGWTFYGTCKSEFNSKGKVVKLCQEVKWEGNVYTSTSLFEWDDHGMKTKYTYTSDAWDNFEYTYENFYDANGFLEKTNTYKDGKFEDIECFVWGDPNAVQGVKAADVTAPWYDLSGRRLSTPPTKGIYIHKGRKIVMK